jgi:hypothetical protein
MRHLPTTFPALEHSKISIPKMYKNFIDRVDLFDLSISALALVSDQQLRYGLSADSHRGSGKFKGDRP